ncbi:MAG: hypothetical protein DBO98_05165 [Candidatus Liberibacter europaeus]|nr:hypothetical protein [Candidatus Liberibacter europaeus]
MSDRGFRTIRSKMICSTVCLGLLSSTSLAAGDNYFAFIPPQSNGSNVMAINNPISSWEGAYIGAEFSKNAKSSGNDTKGIISDPNAESSVRRVFTGYDMQDGSLVYGLSLAAEDHHLSTDQNQSISNASLSIGFRSGFTLNNDNASILQNTLFYATSGLREKNIPVESFKSMSGLKDIINNIANRDFDVFIGTGIEKKLASFLSVKAEYRYNFKDIKELTNCSDLWNKSSITAGFALRF